MNVVKRLAKYSKVQRSMKRSENVANEKWKPVIVRYRSLCSVGIFQQIEWGIKNTRYIKSMQQNMIPINTGATELRIQTTWHSARTHRYCWTAKNTDSTKIQITKNYWKFPHGKLRKDTNACWKIQTLTKHCVLIFKKHYGFTFMKNYVFTSW